MVRVWNMSSRVESFQIFWILKYITEIIWRCKFPGWRVLHEKIILLMKNKYWRAFAFVKWVKYEKLSQVECLTLYESLCTHSTLGTRSLAGLKKPLTMGKSFEFFVPVNAGNCVLVSLSCVFKEFLYGTARRKRSFSTWQIPLTAQGCCKYTSLYNNTAWSVSHTRCRSIKAALLPQNVLCRPGTLFCFPLLNC